MGIHVKIGDKTVDISGVYHKLQDGTTVVIKYIYHGTKLVWSAIKEALSAFSAGYWQNIMPWTNDDGWKNDEK